MLADAESTKATQSDAVETTDDTEEGLGTTLQSLAVRLKGISSRLQEIRKTEGGKPVPDTINRADLSAYSQEVIETFGVNCPAALNDYCCSLEDVFRETAAAQKILIKDICRSYEKNDDMLLTVFSLQDKLLKVKELIDQKDWSGLAELRPEL